MVKKGWIPFSEPPKLTPEQQNQLGLQIALRKKEITLEEAIKQGYKEPKDDLFGASQLMRDDLDRPQSK